MVDREARHAHAVDGRRLRRERGRREVIDAMIDLVLEGHAPPSVEQVAERAGVSQASIYRYFSTLDELRHESISRYFERFDDLIAIPDIGDGPLADRIERFVAKRDALYERTAPMARLTRRLAADVVELGETIGRLRHTFADQIGQHFAPELEPWPEPQRRYRTAIVATLTSFESWDQFAHVGLDREHRTAALTAALADLLYAERPR